MKEFRKRLWHEVALCASFFPLIYSSVAYTADIDEKLIAADMHSKVDVEQDTYTVNFNNISIIEFIRFASKITNLNFVFDQGDLQFSVTVVSEEPVTAKNVMAALSQVLRMHDMMLIEQDGNVLITKSRNVNAIAPIVSADIPHSQAGNSALVTRVFRIKNANVNSIANIIRPMTSQGALIEVSVETKQLIVTDITPNVDQIASLLLSLDAPHTSLEVDTYTVKNVSPADLIALTEQILNPFAEGNPLILVAQNDTNSIFIVSTPHLIERALTVMEDLDIPAKQTVISKQGLVGKNVFLYTPINLSPDQLLSELSLIAKRMKSAGGMPSALEVSIEGVQQVAGSLMFFADADTTTKLKELLSAIDSSTPLGSLSSQVFIYKPQYISSDQMENALNGLIPALQESNTASDQNLVKAIQSMQWNPDTQTFSVTSDSVTVERLKGLIGSFDTPQHVVGAMAKGFFLYKLQYAQCDKVQEELMNVASKLPTSSLQNQNLIASIKKIECIKSNNSLLISGTADAVDQVKSLIVEFDVPSGTAIPSGTFLIYKAKFVPAEEIQLALTSLSSDLQAAGLNDPALFQSISSMRYVESTDSLVFTGTQETLDRIQNILNGIDTSSALGAIQRIGNVTFLLYRIQYAASDKLLASLKSFADNLKQSNAQDKELALSLNTVKFIRETNSLMFTGNPDTLQRVEQVLKNFDIPALQGQATAERAAATFIIYNPKYLTGDELISILCDFMDNLMNSGVTDPGLFDAINNLKWIDKTSSLLVSGDQQSVEKVQQLLVRFDIPGKENAAPSIESIDNTSFLVYKLQFHPGNDIQTALRQVAASMSKGNTPPVALVDAINSLQWVEVTNSLLCTGPQDVLVKLKDLIQNLDIPLRQVFIEVLVIQTSLTNTQQFGLQWGGQAQYFNKATLGTGNFAVPASQGSVTPATNFANTLSGINATTTPKGGQVPFVSGFDLGVIGDIIMNKGKSFVSLGALVNALQLDTDSTILLNPKIITQDNRQSTIFVGQNIPYTGAIVTNISNATVSTSNIEYRDVGMSLTITPILGDGDIITMEIVQDISQVTNNPNTTNTSQIQLTGIQTSHTHMETRVHVPNNYFVALSGMIDDSKTHFKTAIPCLGGLPVIGLLFSESDRTASKGNIIIFVRPQIINTYEEYKKITEHQEWLYKDNARLPVLKEEFDEGIDLIKLPENE